MAGQRTRETILVEAPVERVYEYWRNLENLPRFVTNVERVRATGPGTTHWVVTGPLGAKIEFDARTIRDEPNAAVAWAADNDSLDFSGEALFEEVAPGLTRVEFSVEPATTKRSLKNALRKFAALVEDGGTAPRIEAAVASESQSYMPRVGLAPRRRRLPGSFGGRLVPRADFDDPLPDDALRDIGG